MFFELIGGEMWNALVLFKEGVMNDLKHVEDVGLLNGEGRILRSEGYDGKTWAECDGGTWIRAQGGGPEWV